MANSSFKRPRNYRTYLSLIGAHAEYHPAHEDKDLHTHEFSEVFIIVSGSATHIINEYEYSLSAGDVIALKGDVAHAFKDTHSNLGLINLLYHPEFLLKSFSELHDIPGLAPLFLIEPQIRSRIEYAQSLQLSRQEINYVQTMVDFIIALQDRNDPALYPVLKLHMFALFSYLASQYIAHNSITSQISILMAAEDYMKKHLADPILLADIADCTHLSSRQLERIFHKYYGESPMKHLKTLRLNNGFQLLTQENATVAEAARLSGFDDPSYFAKAFHAAYGLAPSDARPKHSDISTFGYH